MDEETGMIKEKAWAKINFTLSVGEKREDGYHNIDSVMHSISLHDEITMEKENHLSLEILEGTAPSGMDNLMMKAAALFLKERKIDGGVHMTLKKSIPSEAGMGGGSTDAAAVLRGLSRLYETGDTSKDLEELGVRLGADIPFCVEGGAFRCEGIGEKLTRISGWDGLPLLIIRPDTSVSTAYAYHRLDERKEREDNRTEECIRALQSRDRTLLAASLVNDFEAVLIPSEKKLKETVILLSRYARPFRMTGSGSAFFMILDNEEEGEIIRREILSRHPHWFAEITFTRG